METEEGEFLDEEDLDYVNASLSIFDNEVNEDPENK